MFGCRVTVYRNFDGEERVIVEMDVSSAYPESRSFDAIGPRV